MKYELEPGVRIGNYTLVSRIGEGGFGLVWLARDVKMGIMVAIKIFDRKPGMSTDQAKRQQERIRYEGDVVRRLSKASASVPRFHESGVFHGAPYFVMENLVGLMGVGYRGLPAFDSNTRDESEIRAFVINLLNAVDSIHQIGWAHCDIKPSNLMQRGDDPAPVLVDFGSAHLIETESRIPSERSISILPDGKRVLPFTPGYADPSEDMHTVHGDIYAIGQVIRDLFQDDVPLVWAAIINKCLSRNRAYRYASVASIREDVENIKRMRFREYRRLRIAEIGVELDAQRESARYPQHSTTWDELLKGCKKSRGSVNEWAIDFRTHDLFGGKPVDCQVKGMLVLPPRTILTLTGPGVLHCDITGPSSSAVVLCNDIVLHNGARQGTRGDRSAYIQTGGTYLNFTNKSTMSAGVKADVERRVFRSMSAYTELGFCSCENLSDVRKAAVARARQISLPANWKRKLVNYMKGAGFVYYEGRG